MVNPQALLIVMALWIASCASSFFYGKHLEKKACKAGAFDGVSAAVEQYNAAGQRIDGIGAAAAATVAGQINSNRSATDESVERIRKVVVPGDCRRADPVVVRELQAGRDEANAALRGGLRSISAAASAADPIDASGD